MLGSRFAIRVAFVTVLAANAQAQPTHYVSLYSDPGHSTKFAHDNVPGILTVYVVHEAQPIIPHVSVATSLDFRIVQSSGFTGVWLDDSTDYLFLGTSPTGIRLSYGGCLELPARILVVRYTVLGTSDECSYLEIAGHPDEICGSDAICAFDCDFEFRVPIGGRLLINPNAECSALPVASTTWGKIKALYQ